MIHSIVELRGEALHGLFALEPCETLRLMRLLGTYRERVYPEPKKSWDPDEFNQRCYERACIDYLITLIRLNPDMTFNEVCEECLCELEIPYESNETPPEVFEVVSAFYNTLLDLHMWV